MSDTESKEVSTDEPAASTAQGVQNDTSNDFVTEAEKEVIQEWTLYIAGVFASVGLAMGLNGIIQDQWDHSLVSFSGSTNQLGVALAQAGVVANSVWTFLTLGIVGAALLGTLYAKRIENDNNTAYKVGAVTAITGVPILLLVATFLYTVQLDNWDPEFANLLVSGLGGGIAAAVGSAATVWLTENKAPDALQ